MLKIKPCTRPGEDAPATPALSTALEKPVAVDFMARLKECSCMAHQQVKWSTAGVLGLGGLAPTPGWGAWLCSWIFRSLAMWPEERPFSLQEHGFQHMF
jgi:hypothetical protein